MLDSGVLGPQPDPTNPSTSRLGEAGVCPAVPGHRPRHRPRVPAVRLPELGGAVGRGPPGFRGDHQPADPRAARHRAAGLRAPAAGARAPLLHGTTALPCAAGTAASGMRQVLRAPSSTLDHVVPRSRGRLHHLGRTSSAPASAATCAKAGRTPGRGWHGSHCVRRRGPSGTRSIGWVRSGPRTRTGARSSPT